MTRLRWLEACSIASKHRSIALRLWICQWKPLMCSNWRDMVQSWTQSARLFPMTLLSHTMYKMLNFCTVLNSFSRTTRLHVAAKNTLAFCEHAVQRRQMHAFHSYLKFFFVFFSAMLAGPFARALITLNKTFLAAAYAYAFAHTFFLALSVSCSAIKMQ